MTPLDLERAAGRALNEARRRLEQSCHEWRLAMRSHSAERQPGESDEAHATRQEAARLRLQIADQVLLARIGDVEAAVSQLRAAEAARR